VLDELVSLLQVLGSFREQTLQFVQRCHDLAVSVVACPYDQDP
jgi:type III secretory pathway component EscS